MIFTTGRHGKEHMTSAQFRAILESIVGSESYIAPVGNQLAMELAADNMVNISSGMLFHHGGVFEVPEGTYDTANYKNGTQGMKRIDLIVARYTMDAEGIENGEWAVIQGTPDTTNPVAPAYTAGNMQAGNLVDECPVAEIHLDGINVTKIVMLLDVMRPMDAIDMTETLAALQAELAAFKNQMGNVAIKKGSIVKLSNQGDAALLWTLDELRTMFGAPNATTNDFVATVTNGDAVSVKTHIEGTSWLGTNLYAVYDRAVVGSIRFNYVIMYTGN